MDDEVTEFCRQIHPRLVGALDLYCGNLAVAEELAQEALTRAWLRWPKVRRMERPEAWVTHVAFNLARSHLRRALVERRLGLKAHPPNNNDYRDPAEGLALRASLARLRRRPREAVILRFFLQFTYAEIGETLNIPEASARTLVHRALPRLRRDLNHGDISDAE